MAAFSESQITTPDGRVAVDWHLMQNGAVTLFPDRANFDFAAKWLHESSYRVLHIDCAVHATFQQQFSDSLGFQKQFGYNWSGNLDALNDGFSEFDFANVTGVVLAFSQFDALLERDQRAAHAVLDIAEWNSRFHLLFAHRLITIVHCTNRDTTIPKLGGNSSFWNTIRWAGSDAAPHGG